MARGTTGSIIDAGSAGAGVPGTAVTGMTRAGALFLFVGYLLGWGFNLGLHGPVSCRDLDQCLARHTAG